MSSFRLNALSRATRRWSASLGAALLLPSGMALADDSQHGTESIMMRYVAYRNEQYA